MSFKTRMYTDLFKHLVAVALELGISQNFQKRASNPLKFDSTTWSMRLENLGFSEKFWIGSQHWKTKACEDVEIWDCSFDPYVIQPAKRQQYQYSREYIPGNGISQHSHSGIPGPLVKHFPKIASALSGIPGQPAPSSHLKGEKNPVHSASYLQLWITINSLEEQTSTSKHPRNSLLKENSNLLSSFSAPQNSETPTNIHQKWTLMQL